MSESEKQNLNVLLIVGDDTVANYSDYVSRLITGLSSDKCNSGVVSTGDSATDFVSRMDVEFVKYPLIKTVVFEKYSYAKLVDFVAKFKPDIIHTLSNNDLKVTKKLASQFGIPDVVNYFKKPTILSRFETFGDNCQCVFAGNSRIKQKLENTCHDADGKIKRFEYGTFVDDEIACFDNESRLASIAVVHPMESVREFQAFFGALRHLGIDGYEFMVVMIGQGNQDMACRKLVQNMGLSHLVSIVGDVKPLRKFIAGADIFLQPWPSKEFDSSVFEAIAAGLAIAVPDCDGDVLNKGDCLCFDHKDELSLYGVLKELLDNKDKARAMARRGQEHFREQNSDSNMLEVLRRVYFNAIDSYAKSPQKSS